MGILAAAILGTSAIGLDANARDLLVGMFDDVGAILQSFEGGPNDPRSPVNNQDTLQRDSAYLDSATQKAQQLAYELGRLTNQSEDGAH
jgi:hypothetical protein